MQIESIKLVYNEDIKKTKKVPSDFEALKDLIRKSFDIEEGYTIKVQYKDEDGDNVSIGSQNEYAELIESNQGVKTLKLIVKTELKKIEVSNESQGKVIIEPKQEEKQEEKVVEIQEEKQQQDQFEVLSEKEENDENKNQLSNKQEEKLVEKFYEIPQQQQHQEEDIIVNQSQQDTTVQQEEEEEREIEIPQRKVEVERELEIPARKDEEVIIKSEVEGEEEVDEDLHDIDQNEPSIREQIKSVAEANKNFRNIVFSRFKQDSQKYFKKYRNILTQQIKLAKIQQAKEDENRQTDSGLTCTEKRQRQKVLRTRIIMEQYNKVIKSIENLEQNGLPTIEDLEQYENFLRQPIIDAKQAKRDARNQEDNDQQCQRNNLLNKDELRNTVASIVSEMVPMIAAKVTEKINRKQNCQFNNRRRRCQQENNTTTEQQQHNDTTTPATHHATCDNCGKYPIIGNRFKCSVCPDFDFCSSCEETKPHSHPFLKIRTPDQAPRFLFTAINDDQPEEEEEEKVSESQEHGFHHGHHHGHHGHHRGSRWGRGGFGKDFGFKPFFKNIREKFIESQDFRENAQKLAGKFGLNLDQVLSNFCPEFAQRTCQQQQQQQQQQKLEELSCELIRVISTIPEVINTDHNEILKTLLLRNNGTQQWPESAMLLNEQTDEHIKIPSIKPNEEIEVVVKIPINSGLAGQFVSLFKLCYSSNGQNISVGQCLEVFYDVVEIPKIIVPQPKIEEKVEEKIPVIEQLPKTAASYGLSEQEFEKANQLNTLFDGSIDQWVLFIKKNPNKTVEELAAIHLDNE